MPFRAYWFRMPSQGCAHTHTLTHEPLRYLSSGWSETEDVPWGGGGPVWQGIRMLWPGEWGVKLFASISKCVCVLSFAVRLRFLLLYHRSQGNKITLLHMFILPLQRRICVYAAECVCANVCVPAPDSQRQGYWGHTPRNGGGVPNNVIALLWLSLIM